MKLYNNIDLVPNDKWGGVLCLNLGTTMEPEVFNETNEKLKEIDELPDLIKFMAKYMGEEDSEFNVIIVDNEKIHEINA